MKHETIYFTLAAVAVCGLSTSTPTSTQDADEIDLRIT